MLYCTNLESSEPVNWLVVLFAEQSLQCCQKNSFLRTWESFALQTQVLAKMCGGHLIIDNESQTQNMCDSPMPNYRKDALSIVTVKEVRHIRVTYASRWLGYCLNTRSDLSCQHCTHTNRLQKIYSHNLSYWKYNTCAVLECQHLRENTSCKMAVQCSHT